MILFLPRHGKKDCGVMTLKSLLPGGRRNSLCPSGRNSLPAQPGTYLAPWRTYLFCRAEAKDDTNAAAPAGCRINLFPCSIFLCSGSIPACGESDFSCTLNLSLYQAAEYQLLQLHPANIRFLHIPSWLIVI